MNLVVAFASSLHPHPDRSLQTQMRTCSLRQTVNIISSSQSDVSKAASNPCEKLGLPNVPLVPTSLHSKQDVRPFSRFCTAKSRVRLTDRPLAGIIDRNSLYLTPINIITTIRQFIAHITVLRAATTAMSMVPLN